MQNNLINGFNILMAGGDATSGASIAASGTKNNWGGLYLVEEVDKNKVKNPDGTITSTFHNPATGQDYTTVYDEHEVNNYVKFSIGGSVSNVAFNGSLIIDPLSGTYLSFERTLGKGGSNISGSAVVGVIKDSSGKENLNNSEIRKKIFMENYHGYSGFYSYIGGGHYVLDLQPNISMNEVGFGTGQINVHSGSMLTVNLTDYFKKIIKNNLKK